MSRFSGPGGSMRKMRATKRAEAQERDRVGQVRLAEEMRLLEQRERERRVEQARKEARQREHAARKKKG